VVGDEVPSSHLPEHDRALVVAPQDVGIAVAVEIAGSIDLPVGVDVANGAGDVDGDRLGIEQRAVRGRDLVAVVEAVIGRRREIRRREEGQDVGRGIDRSIPSRRRRRSRRSAPCRPDRSP
jgi:hypothetical protein